MPALGNLIMPETLEDFVPHYSSDLMEKLSRVRKVITNLKQHKILELDDISEDEFELLKLSVVNSIKGEMVANEERSRQNFVEEKFLKPAKQAKVITEYKDWSGENKCDFEGTFGNGKKFGLEVKGGEGNSVTLLSRPEEADIFVVWSHLDVMSNTPAENMRAVLGRLVKQLVNKDEKQQKIDFLVFYDQWYISGIKKFKKGPAIPDVFVFPSAIPTQANPHPSAPKDFDKNPFLTALMATIGGKSVSTDDILHHCWYCDIAIEMRKGAWYRTLKVTNCFDPNIFLVKSGSTSAKCKPAP